MRNSADEYADLLGLNDHDVTAVKPSGTIGLVANAGSPGYMFNIALSYQTDSQQEQPVIQGISKLNWHIEDDLQQPDTLL